MDPDQTAPIVREYDQGMPQLHTTDQPTTPVCSGSTLFASILQLVNYSVLVVQQMPSVDCIFSCIFLSALNTLAYFSQTIQPSQVVTVVLKLCASS